MKTIIIHPEDHTTDFLTEVYKDMDCTLIRSLTISKKQLKLLIKEHDRVIFLGHGDGNGLFGKNRYLIDSQLVYLLREKIDAIYIWCHADQFCSKYDLKGFKTGMIVSDYDESLLYSLKCTGDDISESNSKFALALKNAMTAPTSRIVEKIKQLYFTDKNPIIFFNENNLYYS